MSLKALHVVFITVSTLLAAVFGIWAFRLYQAGSGNGYLITTIAAALVAVALVIYGRWFLKKLKHVSYL